MIRLPILVGFVLLVVGQGAYAQEYIATVMDERVSVWDIDVNQAGDRWAILYSKNEFVLDVRIAGAQKPVLIKIPGVVSQAEFMADGVSLVTRHLGSNTHKTPPTLRLWEWDEASGTYAEAATVEREDMLFPATAPTRHEVVASIPGGIMRWDGRSRESEVLFKAKSRYTEQLCKPVYSPDGKEVVTGATGWVVFYTFESDTSEESDESKGEAIRTEEVTGRPHGFAYSPDGKYLAISTPGEGKWSSVISVRKREDSESEPVTLPIDGFWIQQLAFHGDWLVCAGGRHSFATSRQQRKASVPYTVLWNVVTNEQLRLKPPSRREIQRQTAEGRLSFRPHEDTIMGIALVPPDRLMIACVDGLVTMWKLPPKYVTAPTSH